MHFSFVSRKSIMITEFLENLVYWIICQLFGCPNANLAPLTTRHLSHPISINHCILLDLDHILLVTSQWSWDSTSGRLQQWRLSLLILSEENIPLYQTPLRWMLVCKMPNDNISLDLRIWPGITRLGLYNPKMSGPYMV